MKPETRRRKLIAALAGGLTIYHLVAFVRALQLPSAVEAAHTIPVGLQVLMALFWALLFGCLAIMVWRFPKKGTHWTLWASIVFMIYTGGRLVMFAQADYDRGRLSFVVLLMTGMIVALAITLNDTWRNDAL